MADTRTWAKVDVGYFSNYKVEALIEDYPRAVLVHLACILHSRDNHTDGRVALRHAMHFACASLDEVQQAVQIGLLSWEDDENMRTLLVHDYAEHNQTAAELNALSERNRRAAHARHGAPRTASGNASRTASGNASGNAEKRREEKSNCAPADAAAGVFDEWWSHYPKKADKGAARRAFKTALKKADLDTLTAAADLYAKTANPQFYKNPSTWLNAESWANEAPAATGTEDNPSVPSYEGQAWMRGGSW